MTRLTVQPLTAQRWPDFVQLFGEQGVGGGCWCMYWRQPTRRQYVEQKGEPNKRAMGGLVQGGCVTGLLAYDKGKPIGWCAVAPRDEYPLLNRSPSRKPVDEKPVWSITCLYIARSHRGRRLSIELIEAAVAHVRSQGGWMVEGYPVPPKPDLASTSYAYTGFIKAFEAAGFREVCRRFPTRPIMRYTIRQRQKR